MDGRETGRLISLSLSPLDGRRRGGERQVFSYFSVIAYRFSICVQVGRIDTRDGREMSESKKLCNFRADENNASEINAAVYRGELEALIESERNEICFEMDCEMGE